MHWHTPYPQLMHTYRDTDLPRPTLFLPTRDRLREQWSIVAAAVGCPHGGCWGEGAAALAEWYGGG